MVTATHDVLAEGVAMNAPLGTFTTPSAAPPAIVTMRDDDFPARFLQDLAAPGSPPISSATPATIPTDPLFQPVQRMLHVAMVQLACNSAGYPRLDPTRIVSAGVVIRRVAGDAVQGWFRSPAGQFRWTTLAGDAEDADPDPAKRRLHPSGQPELDRLLAAQAQAAASAESTTPAFAAPPDTCAALSRTVVYAMVPTASSEMSDALPVVAPAYGSAAITAQVAASLPTLLQAGTHVAPLAGQAVDYHWMSDDFLSVQFPPPAPTPGRNVTADTRVTQFQMFSTTLRLLKTTFGAFDATSQGRAIMNALNAHAVTFADHSTLPMGTFYANAATALLAYDPSTGAPPSVTMPTAWDALTAGDVALLMNALSAQSQKLLMPQGRFQDPTRLYCLRMFFRVASEHPHCPPELIWSTYSGQFRIAAWFESSGRPTAPIPLPDPFDKNFLANVKPNCSFAVPAGLMNAMQGASMTGLMSGAGGGGGSGSGLTLGWICGFSIPLITICAFFVLNIFLSLLNIIFFWLPFIKICIPFPMPADDEN